MSSPQQCGVCQTTDSIEFWNEEDTICVYCLLDGWTEPQDLTTPSLFLPFQDQSDLDDSRWMTDLNDQDLERDMMEQDALDQCEAWHTNRQAEARERKLALARKGAIACSYCPPHKRENATHHHPRPDRYKDIRRGRS